MENDDKTIIESTLKKSSLNRGSSSQSLNQKTKSHLSKGSIAGIGIGGAVLGSAGAAIPFFAYGKPSHDAGNPTSPDAKDSQTHGDELNEPLSEAPVSHTAVVSDLPVATCVTDDMTPSEAFAAARNEVGPGGIYYYHGHAQGTYYESEWNDLSQEEKDNYWASVQHTHDHHQSLSQQIPANEDIELVDVVDIPDAYIVDANGNELADAIFDVDHDGTGDVLMVDIVVENGEVVSISDAYVGQFDLEQWDAQPIEDFEYTNNVDNDDIDFVDDDNMVYNDYDYSANIDLDNDIFIENNIDTSDMI